jgi:acetylglutamate kinase
MKRSADQLQKFFEATGNEADSLIFLKSFRSIDPEKFLLIYVDTEVVLESFSTLFYDLKMLYSLGLFPVILTSQDSISYIDLFFKDVFNSAKDFKRNEDARFEILPFSPGDVDKIKISVERKNIPFVAIESEEILFETVAEIVKNLLTSKFLILSLRGALRKNTTKEKISIINIRSDYRALAEENCLVSEDKNLLDELKNILENKITHTMNIAITSPVTLLKELFTVNGSGTFIKLGSEIKHTSKIDSVDKLKLVQLLESAFRKKVNPNFLDSKIDSLFLEANYRGAALLKKSENGFLLSKFAVDEIAQGEGIGRDLWNEMKKQHQTIFWRAKPENQIHKWYAKECQGMDKGDDWNVYWINLDVEKIPEVCKYLRSQAQDFIQ